MSQKFNLNVNGKTHTVDADPDMPLLNVLRDDIGLNNPHFGCGLAQCGACTVHLNGQATRSCISPRSATPRSRRRPALAHRTNHPRCRRPMSRSRRCYAAIANAIYDATGERILRVPFSPDRMKAAMS